MTHFAMVCTPAYDGKVDTDCCQSLNQAAQTATLFGIRLTFCQMKNGAFIDLARNTYVRMFLEDKEFSECTHLFFVDSDVGFPPEAFCNLIVNCTEDRPITAGVYPRRQSPIDFPYHFIHNPDIPRRDDQECLWIDDYWLYCDRIPTGFLCIHRSVLEEMAKHVGKIIVSEQPPTPRLFYTKVQDDGKYVGEDFAFCDDYMELYRKGVFPKPPSVQMDIDFKHGGYEGNLKQFLSEKVKEHQEYEATKPRKLGGRRGATRRMRQSAGQANNGGGLPLNVERAGHT